MLEMQKIAVRSLDWEDPLEKGKASHSSILAWKIPWTEELGRLQSMGSQRVGHDWMTEHACMPLISRAWALFTACLYSSQAATAKSLQSCPTLCDPIDGSPPGSPVPGILQAGYVNKSTTAFHFASHWIPSVSRHKELELHWVLRWVLGYWLEDCRFESQLGVREFESHVKCAILQWTIHTTFLGFLLLSPILNTLSEPFCSAILFVAYCSCQAYLYWFLPAGSTNCWKRGMEISNLIVHLSISFSSSISFHVTYFDDFF